MARKRRGNRRRRERAAFVRRTAGQLSDRVHGLWRRTRPLYLDPFHDASRSVLLSTGMGRSGSTWVMSALNYNGAFRTLFEPLRALRTGRGQPWREMERIPRGAPDDDRTRALQAVLEGRIRERRTDALNRRRFVTRRLIKEIRANLMLGWIRERFPAVPIVLLIRHPGAVAESMQRVPGWQFERSGFGHRPEILEEALPPGRSVDEIGADLTGFEKIVVSWCVTHALPFRDLRRGEAHVLFYEDLVTAPADTLPGLLRYVGQPVTQRAFAALDRPSSTARRRGALSRGDPALSWTTRLTSDEIARTREIMSLFGLEGLYGADGLPRHAALDQLMR